MFGLLAGGARGNIDVAFNTQDTDSVFGGAYWKQDYGSHRITGVSFTHTSADGMKAFTLSGEIQSPFDGGYEATGEARVSFRF